MSNIPETPERNAPDPILPEPIGEDGLTRQPDDGALDEQEEVRSAHGDPKPPLPPIAEDKRTPATRNGR